MSTVVLATPRRSPGVPHGLLILPPLLLVLVLFAYPLYLIAVEAFTQDGAVSASRFVEIVRSAFFLRALGNTIEIALGATAGCLLIGFTLATIFSFVPFPGSRVVARLIDTYIALPTFLITLAFTFLYGSAGILNTTLVDLFRLDHAPLDFLYTGWGVVLAEMTVYSPFVMRPVMAAFSLLDRSQLEVASSLGGRPGYVLRRVIMPAAIPALLAGGSLCLLLTVNEFGIVLFIGAKGVVTLPLLIYDKAIQEFDYPTACVIALINIVLSLGLFAAYRLVVSNLGAGRARLV